MDSTLPLSATPRALPSRDNVIRAPLTLDDDSDFESSVSSKSRRNSIASSYASDFDGFLNREDGFETASDTPNSTARDDGVIRGPSAESSPRPNGFVRTFGGSPGLASLLRDSGDADPAPVGEKFTRSPASPMVIGRKTPRLRLPVARASMDSDYESEAYAGFATVVNVPILRRIRSAPKARPSEFGEGDEFNSGNWNVEAVKVVVDRDSSLGSVNGKDGPMSSAQTADTAVQDAPEEDKVDGEHSLSEFMHSNEEIREIDVVSDESPIDVKEPTDLLGTVKLMESEVDDLGCSSNGDQLHSSDEIREIDVVSDESKCVDSIDVREPADLLGTVKLMETEVDDLGCSSNGDQLHSNDEIREIDVINDLSTFADVADQKEPNDLGIISVDASSADLETVKLMEPDVAELGYSSAVSEDNLVFIQDMTSDHLKNESVRSVHSCLDIEEVFSEHCPRFSVSSETLSEKMLAEIAKDEDSSLPWKVEDSALPMDAMPKAEIKNPKEKPLTKTEKAKVEKIQQIRANYLQFLHHLGCPENPVVSKVLHQLAIAEGRVTSQAVHLNSEKRDNLDLSMCILVIGKSGIGKSSTVNSILGEKKAATDAFEPGTTRLKDISVTVEGVKLKVIDTPGLRSSIKDQSINRKVLLSVKRAMQKSPPDVILYVDRLDTAVNYLNDLHVLRSVASCLGSSIWKRAVIALTHAGSAPPDGAHGYPISYEAFVAQQSQCVQQLIRRSTGEFVMANPVALVENNPAAGKNGIGETLLHCGESWRSELLLLCYTVKTLSEMSSVVAEWNPLSIEKLFHMPTHSDFANDHSSDSVADIDTRNGNLPQFVPRKKSLLEYDYLVKLLQSKRMPLPLGDMAVLSSGSPFYGFLDSESTMAELACSLKDKTGFIKFGQNRTTADASIAFLGERAMFGLKIEDNVTVGESLMLVANASIVTTQDNAACGTNVELCRRGVDNPSNWDQISMGLSVTKFRDDLTCRCSLHSQFYVDNGSRFKLSASLSNKLAVQVSVKADSLEPTQVAALVLLPVARAIFEKVFLPQSIKD